MSIVLQTMHFEKTYIYLCVSVGNIWKVLPGRSENLCEFNRRQTSFVSQDKYDTYKRGGSPYGRVGAG